MNSYFGIEMQAMAHLQELGRESAMARLAAQVRRGPTSQPVYRQWLARTLRVFACRIDPTCDSSGGRTPWVAVPS